MENRSLLRANIKSDNSSKQSLTYSSASATKVTLVVETLKPFNMMSNFCSYIRGRAPFCEQWLNVLDRFPRYRGYQAVSGRNI